MKAFSRSMAYIAYMGVVLYSIHEGYSGWLIAVIAGLFFLVWFAFAYPFGGDSDEQ